LIAADPKGAMTPGIATDWSVSADGKTWTVNIRDGVKFHDGTPLTAADVTWTLNHEWSAESLSYNKGATGQAAARNDDKIVQTGPNQVSMTTKIVDSGVPSGLLAEAGPTWIGSILPKRANMNDEPKSLPTKRTPLAPSL